MRLKGISYLSKQRDTPKDTSFTSETTGKHLNLGRDAHHFTDLMAIGNLWEREPPVGLLSRDHCLTDQLKSIQMTWKMTKWWKWSEWGQSRADSQSLLNKLLVIQTMQVWEVQLHGGGKPPKRLHVGYYTNQVWLTHLWHSCQTHFRVRVFQFQKKCPFVSHPTSPPKLLWL